MIDKLTGIDRDTLINYEVIGYWPIYKKNLLDILRSLGAKEKDGRIGFDINNPILNLYPQKLHADAMGYGVEPQWISEVGTDNKSYISLFVETELSKERLDKYFKEQQETAKEIKDWYDCRQLESDKK